MNMKFKISPQTAVWYKNNKHNGKDIFTRKRLSGKRRPFNTYKKLPFVTMFLPSLATERGYIWFPCQRHSTLE